MVEENDKALVNGGSSGKNRAIIASEAEETEEEDLPVDVIDDDEGWCSNLVVFDWENVRADIWLRLDLLDDYPQDVEVCNLHYSPARGMRTDSLTPA